MNIISQNKEVLMNYGVGDMLRIWCVYNDDGAFTDDNLKGDGVAEYHIGNLGYYSTIERAKEVLRAIAINSIYDSTKDLYEMPQDTEE